MVFIVTKVPDHLREDPATPLCRDPLVYSFTDSSTPYISNFSEGFSNTQSNPRTVEGHLIFEVLLYLNTDTTNKNIDRGSCPDRVSSTSDS